jgi:hypothetical protein
MADAFNLRDFVKDTIHTVSFEGRHTASPSSRTDLRHPSGLNAGDETSQALIQPDTSVFQDMSAADKSVFSMANNRDYVRNRCSKKLDPQSGGEAFYYR